MRSPPDPERGRTAGPEPAARKGREKWKHLRTSPEDTPQESRSGETCVICAVVASLQDQLHLVHQWAREIPHLDDEWLLMADYGCRVACSIDWAGPHEAVTS
jgi:hypothetical protein